MFLNVAAYRFVEVADPDALCGQLRERCEALALKGSVLVAEEGINLFLAGGASPLRGFLGELLADRRFAGMELKFSWSEFVPFRRLRVKRRREIITFRRPGLQPAGGRAPAVAPQALADWLRNGRDDAGREIVLLDTRNREETAQGSFVNALRLPIDKFTELPAALEGQRDAFAGKTIVSFCTGGIRCEKAALWMQQAGYENVLQLEGGILGWFEQVGGEAYEGECFVFDDRVALDPQLRPRRSISEGAYGE